VMLKLTLFGAIHCGKVLLEGWFAWHAPNCWDRWGELWYFIWARLSQTISESNAANWRFKITLSFGRGAQSTIKIGIILQKRDSISWLCEGCAFRWGRKLEIIIHLERIGLILYRSQISSEEWLREHIPS
jgi:hypothetical protein